MMFGGILFSLLVAIACGVGLGSVPVVNENLHWNVWVVLPISGVVVGAAIGFLQFGIMRGIGQPVRTVVAALLALGCAVGFASTEVGIYTSTSIDITGDENIPDGTYPLSQLMGFSDYLQAELSSSSYTGDRGGPNFEYGSTGTTITWAIDLAGAFLGGLLTLLGFAKKNPFCERCTVYRKANHKMELNLGEEHVDEVLQEIHERVAEGDYAASVSFLNDSAKLEESDTKKQAFHILAVERVCPTCKEATLMGTVSRKGTNGWDAVDDLAFRLDSGVGDGSRLG